MGLPRDSPAYFIAVYLSPFTIKIRWNTAVPDSKASKVEKHTIWVLFMIHKCEIVLVLRWRRSKNGLLFPKEVNRKEKKCISALI